MIYGVDGGAPSIHTDDTRSTLQYLVLFIGGHIYIYSYTVHIVNGKEFKHRLGRCNEEKNERGRVQKCLSLIYKKNGEGRERREKKKKGVERGTRS